jgi:hypothetical protein
VLVGEYAESIKLERELARQQQSHIQGIERDNLTLLFHAQRDKTIIEILKVCVPYASAMVLLVVAAIGKASGSESMKYLLSLVDEKAILSLAGVPLIWKGAKWLKSRKGTRPELPANRQEPPQLPPPGQELDTGEK